MLVAFLKHIFELKLLVFSLRVTFCTVLFINFHKKRDRRIWFRTGEKWKEVAPSLIFSMKRNLWLTSNSHRLTGNSCWIQAFMLCTVYVWCMVYVVCYTISIEALIFTRSPFNSMMKHFWLNCDISHQCSSFWTVVSSI